MKFRDFINESKIKDSKGNTLRVGDWVSYDKKDWKIIAFTRKNIELRLKSKRESGRESTISIPRSKSNELEQIDMPH